MEKNKFTHGSLFSGIGGPEIAAEEMGWKNMFHCEINPFGRKILDYWFPNSKSYEDITKTNFTEWRGKINVLTGGFPCQPFSCAGQRKGAEDDRYLWPEMLRAIREIQPDWVVGENVAGILSMVQPGSETALGREESLFGEVDRKRILHRQEYVVETVCNDLEREGYFVQPVVIPACAVGAPHRRDRVFFIAHRADAGVKGMQRSCVRASSHSDGERCNNRSDNWKERPICYDQKRDSEENQSERTERKRRTCENGSVASYSQCPGSGQVQQEIQSEQSNGHSFDSNGGEWDAPYSSSEGLSTLRFPTSIEKKKWENEDGCSVQPAGNVRRASFAERWKNFPTQSPVCSRDDGISTRLDGIAFSKWRQESIKAYGNAIVPQVMYEIFQAIQETYNQ
nr:MAG: C-5 cytosine-specific DNA methylase [Bacteriophage sp.]